VDGTGVGVEGTLAEGFGVARGTDVGARGKLGVEHATIKIAIQMPRILSITPHLPGAHCT
jgi:hypothetical protein